LYQTGAPVGHEPEGQGRTAATRRTVLADDARLDDGETGEKGFAACATSIMRVHMVAIAGYPDLVGGTFYLSRVPALMQHLCAHAYRMHMTGSVLDPCFTPQI
jgi:hypothetical protein